eukprot:scaffold33229_cov112-Isochrysis_galbana.AAC.8
MVTSNNEPFRSTAAELAGEEPAESATDTRISRGRTLDRIDRFECVSVTRLYIFGQLTPAPRPYSHIGPAVQAAAAPAPSKRPAAEMGAKSRKKPTEPRNSTSPRAAMQW